MAQQKKYLVLHPVRFNGKLYPRGVEVSLDEKTALAMLDLAVISSNGVSAVIVAVGPSTAESLASFTKLNAMTKEDLVAYAKSTYGVDLDAAAKKETIVAAVHEQFVAKYAPDPLTAELEGAGIGSRI